LLLLLLILRPKLLEASISSLNPASFLCPAVVAIVFVIWMEADSGVISGRVVKLSEVIISLALGGSKVNNKIVLRSFSVSVKVNVLKRLSAVFKRSKQVLKHWNNFVKSTKSACFTTSFKPLGSVLKRPEAVDILCDHRLVS
jgi:hypothetical protein